MLPAPSADALAHQAKLLDHLFMLNQQQRGQLSFAEFMHNALYAPGLGYYSAGLAKIGEAGDFVTAPVISSLFSQALANQCLQILRSLANEAPCILELGAGTGRMAGDLMLYLATQDVLPLHYYILEVSADLKSRQQAYLQAYCPEQYHRFIWLDTLPSEPFTGIILGNEVIDALPCHLFKISDDHTILEGFVEITPTQTQLCFDTPKSQGLQEAIIALQERLGLTFTPGYLSEIHLQLNAWIASLSACLHQGVMLFIDYGFPSHEYYHPSRTCGTLMCHYRHHAHSDPLQYIGLQDITAHVDFTALALAAIAHDLEVAGFTNQGAFLLNNGILTLAEAARNDGQRIAFSQQLQKLIQPHEMGELFKVMALSKQFDESLQGFVAFDQRHRL
ncbi:SAM-dependent methyltransferase [Candidatus Berkiella aquae]|uniref:SAM-dependent methyltransferase n=1 Tax=Candidatus Berkiella aquae TaxID=295108 RepID=A0A0Q9YFQ4_9GAMM|nr:SAM-dependent methyltransferase [Candidatus Berkiella aquae]MCS5709859.1 SAM-dependent methyltransferase [Candidatus Berkiella aquae]